VKEGIYVEGGAGPLERGLDVTALKCEVCREETGRVERGSRAVMGAFVQKGP